MKNDQPIVIVGGGQAAAQTVASLRQWGSNHPITVIANEPHLPYQRPPLSKTFLKGELPTERLWMKPASWYADQNVTVRLNAEVTGIDRRHKHVLIDGNEVVSFNALVLATGSTPHRLNVRGHDLKGIGYLRSIDDVIAINRYAKAGRSIAIVGAGYIGLEVAASMRQMGLNVTVLEMEDRILSRVTSRVVGDYFHALHQKHDVDIRTNAQVRHFVGDDTGVERAVLHDGTELEVDLALIGIGVAANDALARACGIECNDGILVDRDARTSDPDIYAVGDCSRRPLVHFARTGRLESVHNALEQAKLAAASILQRPRPKEDCPWFWSDQFDVKLQIAGLSARYDQLVMRGDPGTDHFAVFYLRRGILIGVDAINSPKEFMGAKPLIASGLKCDVEQLADPEVLLKTLASAS
ncbi:MAG: NAD(P)/FAD-dependent oxidoreductase [Gammaproteobacteria bacterium]